jgi:hypothetical protein
MGIEGELIGEKRSPARVTGGGGRRLAAGPTRRRGGEDRLGNGSGVTGWAEAEMLAGPDLLPEALF